MSATHDTADRDTNSSWFVALGILLILTGIGALVFPLLVALSVELLVGAAMLTGGVFTLVHTFWEKGWSGFLWEALIGAIYLVGGVVFLVNPFGGMIALTLMLGCFFAAEGIARMILAFRLRPDPSWGWVLASGGMSLALGVLIIAGMANGSSQAFIGLIVGINMIFAGASFIAYRNAHRPLPAARARNANAKGGRLACPWRHVPRHLRMSGRTHVACCRRPCRRTRGRGRSWRARGARGLPTRTSAGAVVSGRGSGPCSQAAGGALAGSRTA